MSTTAVVLAGGPEDELAATQPGAANKAFVAIEGRSLVERTLVALRSSRSIGEIIVVAPAATHAHPALAIADSYRPDGKHIRESLRSGLGGLPPDQTILVTTSDLPILNAAAVEDFLARANERPCDIGYGCVERSVHLASYPQIPHTWARFRDGTYCGGGLIAIKPRVLPHLEAFIERLGASRKNPLALARLFGWDMLVRFALRRLTIAQAEARASALLGAPARAIISPFAQSAVNVDRLSDIELARELIRALEEAT